MRQGYIDRDQALKRIYKTAEAAAYLRGRKSNQAMSKISLEIHFGSDVAWELSRVPADQLARDAVLNAWSSGADIGRMEKAYNKGTQEGNRLYGILDKD